MELPTSSCHGVLYPRYYGLVGTSSRKLPGGSRRVVLLSPRVWKGCQRVGTRDWYLMHYSTPSVTGGQKHTHTLEKYPVDIPLEPVDRHIHTFFLLISMRLNTSLTNVVVGLRGIPSAPGNRWSVNDVSMLIMPSIDTAPMLNCTDP